MAHALARYAPKGALVRFGWDAINISLLSERKPLPSVKPLTRITLDSNVTGGKPCGESASPSAQILALIASGHSQAAILSLYSYLKAEDIREALVYAAWRVMEINPQILSE